ncbi:hypothetical protein N007_09140 [Alicyclobacillus acidoterrestris ATCC 49025]|nr:hypothetical protein N007_09140 [Alicyclobacillus acidoterrestris ATCC 49025]
MFIGGIVVVDATWWYDELDRPVMHLGDWLR